MLGGQVVRIIGLDPGLVKTGWGIIEVAGNRLTHVGHGVVNPATSLPLAQRLLHLNQSLRGIIDRESPDEAAVEEVFLNVNAASTLKLGHARAAVMLAPAMTGIPVAEYATKVVKKALVGVGQADKSQVAFMVRRLLPGSNLTAGDAADALAVAICHAHARKLGKIQPGV